MKLLWGGQENPPESFNFNAQQLTFYLRVSLIRATPDQRHYKKRLLKHFPPQLQLGNSRLKQLATPNK
ncbi:MAG TPA: hypothetical protein DCS91_05245 [Microcoleaceae bacterium UBA11344]|nr:hypothetical protein [Microcoleaceae cyanobacterium UBA11344]